MHYYCTKTATKVLSALTEGLNEANPTRKLDNAAGAFMPVTMELLYTDNVNNGDVFSVAHYYEQNSDLMRDPEMTFLRKTVSEAGVDLFYYIPLSFTQDNLGIYHEYFVCDDAGKFTGVRVGLIKDAVLFCTLWMKNIKSQQAL